MKKTLLVLIATTSLLLASCGNEENKKIATVNDTVITQGQLNDALMKQYGTEVLESLMTNEIIKQEAKKAKIEVSEEDLQQEYKIYADYYGGEEALLESMETFHMAKEDILNEIKIYLLTIQLLQKEVTLTEDDIHAYYEENKQSYTTDDGEQLAFEDVKDDVEAALLQEKVDEKYDEWVEEKFEEYDIKTYFK